MHIIIKIDSLLTAYDEPREKFEATLRQALAENGLLPENRLQYVQLSGDSTLCMSKGYGWLERLGNILQSLFGRESVSEQKPLAASREAVESFIKSWREQFRTPEFLSAYLELSVEDRKRVDSALRELLNKELQERNTGVEVLEFSINVEQEEDPRVTQLRETLKDETYQALYKAWQQEAVRILDEGGSLKEIKQKIQKLSEDLFRKKG